MDTIFAISTAPGKAGVAVLRLSGPLSHGVTEAFGGALPPPREMGLRALKDRDGGLLDEALVVIFEQSKSFTGETAAEWHLHGSIATQAAVLRALSQEPGCRPAEAGEFTRRALENNRLDLAQVEGLSDLIEAETDAQRQRALRSLGGAVADLVEVWRRDLIRAAALLEATIDFADEDVPEDLSDEVLELTSSVGASLADNVVGAAAGERIRQGFEVAIVGAPNVGKSTLLNRLAGREAAITSEYAGTTRDIIEVRMEIAGLPVTLLDTAGLRDTDDPVERIGVEIARKRAAAADLRVGLFLTDPPSGGPQDINVLAKSDGSTGLADGISGKSGAGVDALLEEIGQRLSGMTQSAGIFDRERHRVDADTALKALENAQALLKNHPERVEAAAEDIRSAMRALERLVGRVDVENLLDDIFSSFCIGK
ncbi:MAG: tRNA uridine-5-carboxymethylaminomethyl(34) synthesis GTPase MnmE [Pseudomonadota bacterium]